MLRKEDERSVKDGGKVGVDFKINTRENQNFPVL